MPPVGVYVRPFRTVNDDRTASRHSRSYRQRNDHSFHHCSASATTATGSSVVSQRSFDGYHVRRNGTLSPAVTVNEATLDSSRPRTSTGVPSRTASGPPIAT